MSKKLFILLAAVLIICFIETERCAAEAQGQQMHFLEIFSADFPDPYSWTRVSQNGKTDRTITIPYTGLYFVRVRTHKNGSTGLCSLNINDELFYEDVPMCSMGVRSNFALTTDEYNVFTANCKGDPFLCINKGNDLNGVVWSFNDDYFGEGDFDWGRNARIKRTFSSTTNTSRILVLSSVSLDPVGSCELYVGCRNYPIDEYFVNLDRAVMENVVLLNQQEEFLENQISDIDNEVLTKFNTLYSAWDNEGKMSLVRISVNGNVVVKKIIHN